MDKKKDWITPVFTVGIIIVMLLILLFEEDYDSYDYTDEDHDNYYNYSDAPYDHNYSGSITQDEIEDNFSNVKYIHWKKLPILYWIEEDECKSETQTIINSFNIIQNTTKNIVNFNRSNYESADIRIYCELVGYQEDEITTLGEAFFNNNESNILSAEITFYVKGTEEIRMVDYCESGFPATEVHEILHTFGFGHDHSPIHIMNSVSIPGKCGISKINNNIKDCLIYIYTNGSRGNCMDVIFTDPDSQYGECPDGWYPASREYCCEEPGMIINSLGECDYY